MSSLYVGISGWKYTPWRGIFYPKSCPQKRELEYASRQVNSIEINGSFYSLKRPSNYQTWYAETPAGFVFSIKGSRYITHTKRLKDVEIPLANFFASGVLCLEEKLGPFLWQLPPSFRYDKELLEEFFKLLPRTTKDANDLASKHTFAGEKHPPINDNYRLRHAIEVRHPSFQCKEFIQQLREKNIALVVADTAGKWPFMEDISSDFIYIRLHGAEKLYFSGYTEKSLTEWERKIRTWSKGSIPKSSELIVKSKPPKTARDVYVYFDNDVKVHAPYDAMSLAYRLGIAEEPEGKPDLKSIKEEPRSKWPEVKPRWHQK